MKKIKIKFKNIVILSGVTISAIVGTALGVKFLSPKNNNSNKNNNSISNSNQSNNNDNKEKQDVVINNQSKKENNSLSSSETTKKQEPLTNNKETKKQPEEISNKANPETNPKNLDSKTNSNDSVEKTQEKTNSNDFSSSSNETPKPQESTDRNTESKNQLQENESNKNSQTNSNTIDNEKNQNPQITQPEAKTEQENNQSSSKETRTQSQTTSNDAQEQNQTNEAKTDSNQNLESERKGSTIEQNPDQDSNNKTKNTTESENTNLENNKTPSQLSVINYVAIGDSISAGFNSEYGFGISGMLKEDNRILGLSYPAFIAHYLKKIKPDSLEGFDNFGLTGTRIVDWLYILGNPNDDYNVSEGMEYFNFLLNLDKLENNPLKDRIKNQFNNFQEGDFENIRSKIKQANLMTVSLGANDLLSNLPIEKLKLLLSATTIEERENILNDLITELNQTLTINKQNLIKLVNKIKELNPTIKINFVGYPMPLLRMVKMIDNFINLGENKKFSLSILNLLNNSLKEVAQDTQTFYIDIYDQDDWERDNEKLAKVFYDIHPTEVGYKKMAQDIVLKWTLNQQEAFEIPHWDENYKNKDKNSYNKIIDLGLSNQMLIEKVLGSNDLFNKTELETNEEIIKFKKDAQISHVIKNWVISNPKRINSMLLFVLKMLDIQDETKLSNIKTFFETTDEKNQSNFFKLAQKFASSNFLGNIIIGIQKDLDQDLDENNVPGTQEITWDIIKKIAIKNLLNEENIVSFIKEMTSDNLIKENHEILSTIITDFIWKKAPKLLEKININSEIKDFVAKNQNIYELIKLSISNFIQNSQNYENATTIKDLIKIYYENNKTILKEKMTLIVQEAMKTKWLTNFILNKMSIEASESNSEIMVNFLTDFSTVISNSSVLEKIMNNIIQKFISDKTSIFDFNVEMFSDINSLINFANMDVFLEVFKAIASNEESIDKFFKLFNLLFEHKTFADKTQDITQEDNPFIYYLANLNNDPDRSKRTALSLNDLTTMSSAIGSDYLSKTMKILFNKMKEYKTQNPQILDKNNPYRKAMFRFTTLLLWFSYETYARESWFRSWIYWTTTNDLTIEGQIFEYLTKFPDTTNLEEKNKNKEIKNLIESFYGQRKPKEESRSLWSSWFSKKEIPTAEKHNKEDVMAMIYYENEIDIFNRNQKNKDRIFQYLRQGYSETGK